MITSLGTDIICLRRETGSTELFMQRRTIEPRKEVKLVSFKVDELWNHDHICEELELQIELCKPIVMKRPKRNNHEDYQASVLHKRRRILTCILQYPELGLNKIAKQESSSWATVKRVYEYYKRFGSIEPYNYNFKKPLELITQMKNSINNEQHQFWSTTDYKRMFPSVSKKFIASQLKMEGFQYSRLKTGKDLVKRKMKVRSQSKEQSITSHVLASLQPNSTMYFMDQIKLIMYQTPK